MWSRCALLGLSLLLLLAQPAHGHHVVSDLAMTPVLPASLVGVEVSGASFDVSGVEGRWLAITPQAELQLGRHLSLMAALPLARVTYQGGDSHAGLGDAALSAKVRLYATEHGGLLLSGGLGAELPTGNDHNGLGGGHLELAPFLIAASSLSSGPGPEWVVHGLGSLRLALAGHDHDHVHAGEVSGSMLSPHASRELYARLMTGLVWGPAYLAAGVEGVRVLEGTPPGQVALRGELGGLAGPSVRLFLAVDATVAGEHRYGLRAHVGSAWLF